MLQNMVHQDFCTTASLEWIREGLEIVDYINGADIIFVWVDPALQSFVSATNIKSQLDLPFLLGKYWEPYL